jgi:hypothetical protein
MPTHEHKETRMSFAVGLISMVNQDIDFLNIIVTVNETLCSLYDPQHKHQWKHQCKSKLSHQKQKICVDKSKGKGMLEVFFDSQSLVHYEFVLKRHTIDKKKSKLNPLSLDAVRRKRPQKMAMYVPYQT